MKTKEELKEYIRDFNLENSLTLTEEETISAIIGYEDESRAIVYDYDKLVDSFIEHFRKYETDASEEDLINEAEEWISCNTMRSLPYKESDYIAYDKDWNEIERIPIRSEGSMEKALKIAGEGGHVDTITYKNPIIIYSCKGWDELCSSKPYEFDASKVKEELIQWIRDEVKDKNAIVQINENDSNDVIAALCVEALGKDRVIGVFFPCGPSEIHGHAKRIADVLGIKFIECNRDFQNEFKTISFIEDGKANSINGWDYYLQKRMEMMVINRIAQSYNGLVCCGLTLSDYLIGNFVPYGNSVGDIAPLLKITNTETIALKNLFENISSLKCKYINAMEKSDKFVREGKYEKKEDIDLFIKYHEESIKDIQNVSIPCYDPNLPINI